MAESGRSPNQSASAAETQGKALLEEILRTKRTKLGAAMAEGPKEFDELVEDFMYYAMIHHWFGDTESGKSMKAESVAGSLIRRGISVVYIDDENGQEIIIDRLLGFGLEPEEVDAHFYYCGDVDLSSKEPIWLHHLARGVGAKLVIFDSLIGFLGQDGISENDNTEVSGWIRKVCNPLKASGIASVLLDHTGKDGKNRGASRKIQAADVSYRVTKKGDFDRETIGYIFFEREKDRIAQLDRYLGFRIGGDGTGRIHDVRSDKPVEPKSSISENASRLLEVLPEDGLTNGGWRKSTGLANSSFDKARKELLKKKLVLAPEVKGGLYRPTTPLLHSTDNSDGVDHGVQSPNNSTSLHTPVGGGVVEYGEYLEEESIRVDEPSGEEPLSRGDLPRNQDDTGVETSSGKLQTNGSLPRRVFNSDEEAWEYVNSHGLPFGNLRA